MKEYIEKILHQDVQLVPYENVNKLPLVYRNSYDFRIVIVGGHKALLAAPEEAVPLSYLRKQQHQIAFYTGLPCVLYLQNMNYYTRDALLNEGIPFVWEGHQIYLPFAGTLLNENQRPAVTACMQISFLTQKLLLTALYNDWKKVTVTKAAALLKVSKMSVTRCFDELEAMNIPYLTVRNRARSFTAEPDKRKMWENIHGCMRNPVIKTYALREMTKKAQILSGTAALAHYSMLGEGPYPIFAITKADGVNIPRGDMISAGETPACIVQKLGCIIPYENGAAVDPLTTVLSISDEEKSDPRVSIAIEEMLEKYVW